MKKLINRLRANKPERIRHSESYRHGKSQLIQATAEYNIADGNLQVSITRGTEDDYSLQINIPYHWQTKQIPNTYVRTLDSFRNDWQINSNKKNIVYRLKNISGIETLSIINAHDQGITKCREIEEKFKGTFLTNKHLLN